MFKWSKNILFLFIFTTLLLIILTGVFAYKYSYFSKLRIFFDSVPGYVLAQFEKKNLKKNQISIKIAKEDFEKLKIKREKILDFKSDVAIVESYNDTGQFVKAKLNYMDRNIEAKLTLGGLQHGLKYEKKWPFRVKLEDNQTLFGVNKFVLYHPKKRNYIFEWLFHKAFNEENGISPYYDFVPVSINDNYSGIYAIEESFDKKMLEKNNKADNPIIKIDMSQYRLKKQLNDGAVDDFTAWKDLPIIFWQENEKYKNNKIFKENFAIALNLYDGFRNNLYTTTETFNLKKLASYVALCDLFQGQHALLDHNLMLYFDSDTSLLEPISFESNSIDPRMDLSIEIARTTKDDLHLNIRNFFKDEKFVKEYIQHLQYYSDRKFLDNFLSSVDKQINKKLKILNSEFFYINKKKINILYKQQDFIRTNLAKIIKGK